jgi:hypothetical protein
MNAEITRINGNDEPLLLPDLLPDMLLDVFKYNDSTALLALRLVNQRLYIIATKSLFNNECSLPYQKKLIEC